MKIAFACIFVFLAAPISANQDGTNPLAKVVELLEVLSKEIAVEGREDAKTYKILTEHYNEEARHTKVIIEDSANKIAQLGSDLREAEAFREGKNKDLVDLANWLAHDEMELTAGRKTRDNEHAVFEKNEATFSESVNQLEGALYALKKKPPQDASSAAASAASLISVAKELKKTLTQGFSFPLSRAETETLHSFFVTAYSTEDLQNSGGQQSAAAPSFLQQKANLRGPFGEYTSSSGGLLSTLENLQGKVQRERDAALEEEQHTKQYFEEWETGLVAMLENGKHSLADIRSSIAQSQQHSSQQKATLMESTEIHKTEVEHMDLVEADFRERTQAYKTLLGRRSDEATAVHEARRLLGSELAKSYIKHQTIGSVDHGASNLLQVALEKKAVWRKSLFKRKARGVALLALKSAVHRVRTTGMEPFGKVQSMIKGMLERLMTAQASEATHAAWCDQEFQKSSKAKKRKEDDIQNLRDRIEALLADLEETKSDINDISKDVKELNAATAEAVALRQKEHNNAKTAIETYRNGAALLKRGLNVLKSYYGKRGGEAKMDGNTAKQRHGMGSGIIAVLEMAIDDFKKLYAESKEAEAAANSEFQRLQSETAIRSAIFEKGMEWKTRTKVKLEYDESQMKNDLKSYEEHLSAIDSYMQKLNAMCIVRGPSYEERKATREAQLSSLKEALTVIQSRDLLR